MELPRYFSEIVPGGIRLPQGTRVGVPYVSQGPRLDVGEAAQIAGAPGRAISKGLEDVAQVSDHMMKAEAKTRALQEETEALDLFVKYSRVSEDMGLKLLEDPDRASYYPKLREVLSKARTEGLKESRTPRVAHTFAQRFATYELSALDQGSKIHLQRFVEDQEASLSRSVEDSRVRAEKATDEPTFNAYLSQGESAIRNAGGVLNPKTVEEKVQKFKDSVYLGRAQREAFESPKAFLGGLFGEKQEGSAGWRKYEGKVDQTTLETLKRETQSRAISMENAYHANGEQRRKDVELARKQEATTKYAEFVDLLTPGADPSKRPPADVVLAFVKHYQSLGALGVEEAGALRKLALAPTLEGGVTHPTRYNALVVKLYQDRLTKEELAQALTDEDLSVDDFGKLTKTLGERSRADDVSHQPGYRTGREQIHLRLGQGDPQNPLALMVPMFRDPFLAQKHGAVLADALAEYDRRARSGKAGMSLLELGTKVAEEFYPRLEPLLKLGGGGAGTGAGTPPGTSTATPPGSPAPKPPAGTTTAAPPGR